MSSLNSSSSASLNLVRTLRQRANRVYDGVNIFRAFRTFRQRGLRRTNFDEPYEEATILTERAFYVERSSILDIAEFFLVLQKHFDKELLISIDTFLNFFQYSGTFEDFVLQWKFLKPLEKVGSPQLELFVAVRVVVRKYEAAATIQAIFRGFRHRKMMRSIDRIRRYNKLIMKYTYDYLDVGIAAARKVARAVAARFRLMGFALRCDHTTLGAMLYCVFEMHTSISHVQDFRDVSLIVFRFIQNINNLRLTEMVSGMAEAMVIVPSVIHEWLGLFKELVTSSHRPNAGEHKFSDFFTMLRQGKDSMLAVISSPVIYRFLCLIRYCITRIVAWAVGLDSQNAVMEFANNCVPSEPFAFWSFVTSTVVDFCDGGCQYFMEGNKFSFVHSAVTYKKWANEVTELTGLFDRRAQDESVVGPNEITCTDYRVRVDKAYTFGKEILQAASLRKKISPNEYNQLLKVMGSLEDITGKLYAEDLSGKTRNQPYALIFYGPSSCGKSHLCHFSIECVHNLVSNLPFERSMIYTASPGSEYEEGLTRTKIYEIFDELGAENHAKTTTTPANQVSLLQKINTQPMTVNMAELTRKGKVNYGIKFCVGTSNNPDFAHPYFDSPAAVYRRFQLHIFTELFDEFAVHDSEGRNTGVLDKWKVKEYEQEHGSKPFVWRLKIKRVLLNPDNLKKIRYTEPEVITTWEAFKDFLRSDYRRYKEGLSISAAGLEFGDCNFCIQCDQLKCVCFARLVDQEMPHSMLEWTVVAYPTMFVGVLQILVWSFSHIVKPIYSRFVRNSAKNLLRDGVQDAGSKMHEYIMGANVSLLVLALGLAFKSMQMYALPTMIANCDNEERAAPLEMYHTKVVGKERNKYEPLPVHSLQLECTPGVQGDHVEQAISLNLRSLEVRTGSTPAKCMRVLALGVHDHYYITPWHFWEKKLNDIRWIQFVDFNNSSISPSRLIPFDSSLLTRVKDEQGIEMDLAIIRVLGTPAVRDILKFFPESLPELGVTTMGRVIASDYDTGEMEVVITKATSQIVQHYGVDVPLSKGFRYNYSKVGACMSPFVVRVNNTYTIGGLHISGSTKPGEVAGSCVSITRAMITEVTGKVIVRDIKRLPGALEYTSKTAPVYHDKNMFNWMTGCATLHGEEVGVPTSNARSDARASLIRDYVEKEKGESPFRPSEVKVGNIRGVWTNAFQKGFEGTMQRLVTIPPALLESAKKSYLERLHRWLPPVEPEFCRPLTDYEAINGIQGVAFYGGINRKAGAGYGSSKKHKYLVDDPRPGYPNGVNFTPDIYSELDIMRQEIYLGNMVRPTFKANLKNEMRSLKERSPEQQQEIRDLFPNLSDEEISTAVKADYNFVTHYIKDARVFMGAPMLWSHEMRRLFLPVIRLLQLHNLVSECAVGVNHASGDWARIYKYVTKYGEEAGAGDGKEFDKGQPPEVILTDGEICEEIARKWLKYSERDLMAMRILIEDFAFPLVHVLFTLVTFHGGLASGGIVTVNFNSLTNSLYMRVAWMLLGFDIDRFNDEVNLITYGDDNLFGTKEKGYNYSSIAKAFKQINMEYTPPDKSTEDFAFKHISQLSFLKRRFVPRDGRIFAPLEENSMWRMLSWIVDSKLSPSEHLFSIIPAIELELYQYGSDYYNYHKEWLESCPVVQDHGIVLRSFEQIDEAYKERYEVNALGEEPQSNSWDNAWSDPSDNVPDNACSDPRTTPWDGVKAAYGFESMSNLNQNSHDGVIISHVHNPSVMEESCQSFPRVATPRRAYLGWSPLTPQYRGNRNFNESRSSCNKRLANNNYGKSLADSYKTAAEPDRLGQDQCTSEENVAWLDMNAGTQAMVPTYADPTTREATSIATLGDVLSRPVKIYSDLWTAGDATFGGSLDPWYDWSQDPMVQSKLQHFHLLRGDLKITVKINGSPVYAGQMIFAYSPLEPLRTSAPISTLSAVGRERAKISFSQMMHMYIDAATSEGGCMCLPFIWPDNALNIQNAADFNNMGRLFFQTMAPLRTVTTPGPPVAGTHAEITVFAQLLPGYSLQVPTISSDVAQGASQFRELDCECPSQCFPRFHFVRKDRVKVAPDSTSATDMGPQSESEYKDETEGIVSRPAKVISNIASKLVDAPVIGPFAQATSVAAGAVGDIAKLFGFSAPADIRPSTTMYAVQTGNLANTSGGCLVNKLTMDPKQGLSVDPRLTGLERGDEMTIKSVAGRESYIGSFDWDASQSTGTNLFSLAITPGLAYVETRTHDVAYQMTPMCLSALNFVAWSGTINVRLQVIASPFNKGRLKITYDPTDATNATLSNTFNTSYTNVLDLSSSRDVIIPIRWAQKELYKKCPTLDDIATTTTFGTTAATIGSEFCNGYLGIQVLNELPRIAKTVESEQVLTVLVFVSAGEDFQLQNPSGEISTLKWHETQSMSEWRPQSDADAFAEQKSPVDPENATDVGVMGEGIGGTILYKDLVCYGDPVTSFRALLKRFQYKGIVTWDPDQSAINGMYLFQQARCNFPDPNGFQAGNYWLAPDNLGVDQPYNPDKMTLISLLSGCYVARRGGIRRKYVIKWTSAGSNPHVKAWVVRSNGNQSHPSIVSFLDPTHAYPGNPINEPLSLGNEAEGAYAVVSSLQGAINVELPATTPKRFYLGQGATYGGNSFDHSDMNTHRVYLEKFVQTSNWPTHVGGLDDYIAAADDFSLVYFNFVPTLYTYDVTRVVNGHV